MTSLVFGLIFSFLRRDGGLRQSEPSLWCCGDVRRKLEDGRKTFLLKVRQEILFKHINI